MTALKYHRKTFELLGREPTVSDHALRLIPMVEQQSGFVLPPSLWEWYSLDAAKEILARGQDWPTPLERLGQPVEDWSEIGSRDLLSEGYVVVLTENQGVCHWAVRLDGSNDPPVVVEVDSAPEIVWRRCADSFSTWLYTLAWDWQQFGGHALSAQDMPLEPSALSFLQGHFSEGPRTYGWPGKTTYRFSLGDQRVLIWSDEGQADWFLWADTSESLFQLVSAVLGLGGLSETLYGLDEVGAEALRNARGKPKSG